MTPLELLAVLVLAGAIVVLLYFYLQDNQNRSLSRARSAIVETGQKARSTVSDAGDKVINNDNGTGGVGDKMSGINEKASGIGDKARTVVSGVGEKVSGTGESSSEGGMMGSVSEKVSGVGERLKGSVKSVPKSSDNLSNKIDMFLDDKSDQLIKDWELATKNDILDIDKKYNKVKRDIGELDSRFNEYRGATNKKIKKIEERLDKLENP
jgi:archaellum component FlaC